MSSPDAAGERRDPGGRVSGRSGSGRSAGAGGSGYAIVTFLSDFGHDDVFVGVCHGVLADRAPHARVIDLVHTVPPQDVRTGALMLARAVPHLPVAVHLGVVDPGVGTARRGLAIRARRGDAFVVPDNGLAEPALRALGGAVGAVELASPHHRAPRVSATFHGRDVFAPAAAALAGGLDLAELGPPAGERKGLALPEARRTGAGLEAEVVLVDRFGNLQLGAVPQDVESLGLGAGDPAEVVRAGRQRVVPVRVVTTFGELAEGEVGLYEDSDRQMALAVNRGSAARTLGLGLRDTVTIRACRA